MRLGFRNMTLYTFDVYYSQERVFENTISKHLVITDNPHHAMTTHYLDLGHDLLRRTADSAAMVDYVRRVHHDFADLVQDLHRVYTHRNCWVDRPDCIRDNQPAGKASDTPDDVVVVAGILDHTETVLDKDVVAVDKDRVIVVVCETFDVRRSWVTWHRSKRSGEQPGSSSP